MEGDAEQIDEQIDVAPGPGRGLFQCAQCSRRFARMDHLSRHIRTHTHEKPHRCAVCNKHFARADLLRRHAWRHEDPAGRDEQKKLQQGKVRASKACQACASSKLKCDNNRPCQRCAKRGQPCEGPGAGNVLSDGDGRPGSSRSSLSGQHESNRMTGRILDSSATFNDDAATVMPNGFSAVSDIAMRQNGSFGEPNIIDMSLNNFDFDDQPPNDAQADEQASWQYSDFLRDLLFASPQAMSSGTALQQDVHRFDFWDLDLEGSLDYTNALADVPYSDIIALPTLVQPSSGTTQEGEPTSGESPEQLALAAGSRAFSASVWHWVPTSSDNRAEGQADLAMSANSSGRTDATLTLSKDILSKRLGSNDRDRVLSVLLAHCERSSVVRVASSFPSYEIMEKLVHTSLHFQTVGTVSWLHIPTFSSDNTKDEFLSALVAYGAFLSPVSANQKLGTAMADVLRMAVAELFETNNANTRDLQSLQCFLTVYHLLFWSGSKRRMEIGESFTQPLITMLRRSGAMMRSNYRQIIPRPDDTAETLDTKWKAWVEQETRIRIVHHMFLHDAQISMTQFINPLLSAADMTLPPPANDDLWSARTADEWRVNYVSLLGVSEGQSSISYRVRDAINQTSLNILSNFQADSATDVFALYGLWNMIWDCQLSNSWLKAGIRWNDQREMLPTGRFSVLSRILDGFESNSASSHTRSVDRKHAEKAIIIAYLRLALCAPIRYLPAFAGRDGEAEAQTVYFTLQEWAQSREGRQSVWHAGQILRHARTLPHLLMKAFFAVSIYHAGLVLWSFAIITGARQKKTGLSSLSPGTADKILWLDGEPSTQLHNFIALGEGNPAISNSSIENAAEDVTLLLFNPGAIMHVAIQILKTPTRLRDHNLSPFVESLVQLMEDLAKAAKSVGLG